MIYTGLLKKIRSYCHETRKVISVKDVSPNMLEIIKTFPRWLSSQKPGRNPIDDQWPWFNFASKDCLEKILKKEMTVFEYGSGGSTLFFAKRCESVTSIEHDVGWAEKVRSTMISKGFKNWNYYVEQPSSYDSDSKAASDPRQYLSGSSKYYGMQFKNYACLIDQFPDASFDIVLIDGRARPSCFMHSFRKVKRGGYIILDNAERPHYSYIHDTLTKEKWIKRDFYGPGPYVEYFWRTTIWQNKSDSIG